MPSSSPGANSHFQPFNNFKVLFLHDGFTSIVLSHSWSQDPQASLITFTWWLWHLCLWLWPTPLSSKSVSFLLLSNFISKWFLTPGTQSVSVILSDLTVNSSWWYLLWSFQEELIMSLRVSYHCGVTFYRPTLTVMGCVCVCFSYWLWISWGQDSCFLYQFIN